MNTSSKTNAEYLKDLLNTTNEHITIGKSKLAKTNNPSHEDYIEYFQLIKLRNQLQTILKIDS
jgi:transcription elongation factor